MEVYATARRPLTVDDLRRLLPIRELPRWCASITEVFSDEGARGEMYCVWGRYRIHREEIRDGVRFTLPGCPNALQWTLTTGRTDHPNSVVIHLTINRTEHDPDFIESLRQFVEDWKAGLERD